MLQAGALNNISIILNDSGLDGSDGSFSLLLFSHLLVLDFSLSLLDLFLVEFVSNFFGSGPVS